MARIDGGAGRKIPLRPALGASEIVLRISSDFSPGKIVLTESLEQAHPAPPAIRAGWVMAGTE